MSTITSQSGLARRRLSALHLMFFTISASAPMTVLIGGIVTAFLVTGNTGMPLVFPILAVALGLFSVGYAAMSRYVANAGAFYSYLAQGLGRAWGVSGSFVALVAYNAMQIGLYGLFGVVAADLMANRFNIDLQWWVWGFGALVIIGILGVLRVDLNARVLAVLLILEVLAVATYDVIAFGNPASGSYQVEGFNPTNLFTAGVGGAFAFGIASFIGFESGAIYSEEAKDPRRTVARATYAALAFTGLFYAISAWAITVNLGADQVIAATQKDNAGVIFGLLETQAGTLVSDIAGVLLVTSIFAALLSFHNGVARYLFALGRERVLPPGLGRTGVGSGAPIAGSLIQSLLAIVAVGVFVVLERDPLAELFTWLTYMGAVGVLTLMTGTSLSVIGFFARRNDSVESFWQRGFAPTLGAIALATITTLTIVNSHDVLGTAKDSPLRWILPGIVGAGAVIGLLWGLILRGAKPDLYQGIGRGAIEPLEMAPHAPAHAQPL